MQRTQASSLVLFISFRFNAKNEFHFIGRKETGRRSLFSRDGLSFGYTPGGWRRTELCRRIWCLDTRSVPFVIDLCVLRVRGLYTPILLFLVIFPLRSERNVADISFIVSPDVEKYFEIYFLSSKQRDRWAVYQWRFIIWVTLVFIGSVFS